MTQFLVINFLLAVSQIPQSQFDISNPFLNKSEPMSVVLSNDISILKSTSDGISFRYSVDDEQLEQQKVHYGNKDYVIFNINGAVRQGQPGQFDLPSKEIIIGIPQQGNVTISAEPISAKSLQNIEMPPVPFRTWEKAPEYRLSQDIKSDFFPENICEIKEISYIRDIRIARIKLNPIQYSHLTKQVIINSDVIIRVQFSQTAHEYSKPDYFDGIVQEILLNGEIAKNWKLESSDKMLESGQSRYPQGFLNWYKIKVETTGVYKISYNELNQAGVSIRLIDPRTIRLFNIGEYTSNVTYPDTMIEIPIYISGEADSVFDKKDYILFYGVSSARYNKNRTSFYNNPFTRYNYYWLTWGFSTNISGFGKRIEQVTSSQQAIKVYSAKNYIHLEKDRDCPARSGLLWTWELYTKTSDISTKTFNLSLELQNPESLYSISGRFYGQTNANWMKIGLNNLMLDSFYFPGQSTSPPPFNFLINRRLSLGATNTLSFTLYNTPEQTVFFDFLKVHYLQRLEFLQGERDMYFYASPGSQSFAIRKVGSKPLILDISNYNAPRMFIDYYTNRDTIIFGTTTQETTFYYVLDETKARKVLSIEQRQPGQTTHYSNTHYFIITSDELYPSALLMENYRRNNIAGIPQAQTKAVPLSQVYDDFTFGIEEPGAIKRLFKKYRPYYGLLLGDGTYDYRNILQLTTFPVVPAYEQGYDIDFQVYSEAALAIDAWYSDFEGLGSTPDMMLGRVTARTHSEVRRFYDKLVNYETKRSAGFWNKRFIFLADDEWKTQGIIDEFVQGHIIDHVAKCEELEQSLYYSTSNRFRNLEPVKIYLTEYPFTQHDDKRQAREALISELNKGASLWCFFGHGAGFQLCHEQALNISHIPLIHTQKRNSIAFFGSCGVGRFEDTKFESISEELVRKEDAAIATIAATKATDSGSNFNFAFAFFNKIISQPESTIGRAFMTVMNYNYYNYKYHLFGDPATVPALPNTFTNITSEPDTFRSAQFVQNYGQANGSEFFAASAYSPKWQRYYQSIYYVPQIPPNPPRPETIMMNYNLSGYELFRYIGRPINDSIKFHFTIPTGLPRGFRYDIISGGGSYTEINNSARVSAIAYTPGQNTLRSFLKDSIVFDTIPATITDFAGPKIMFYNEDKRIKPNDKVSKQFTLTGILSDSAGILLTPISGYNPRLIIRKRPHHTIEDVDVTSYFTYDIGNYYQGRFSYPVTLDTGDCVIIIKAADNLRNQNTDSVAVTVQKNQNLDLGNVSYYSPANSRIGYFTFMLTQPAMVGIKIYTINGRLVKTFSERLSNYGYNQIIWDGFDEDGIPPANGVYLYKISARSFTSGREQKNSVVEKFIIMH